MGVLVAVRLFRRGASGCAVMLPRGSQAHFPEDHWWDMSVPVCSPPVVLFLVLGQKSSFSVVLRASPFSAGRAAASHSPAGLVRAQPRSKRGGSRRPACELCSLCFVLSGVHLVYRKSVCPTPAKRLPSQSVTVANLLIQLTSLSLHSAGVGSLVASAVVLSSSRSCAVRAKARRGGSTCTGPSFLCSCVPDSCHTLSEGEDGISDEIQLLKYF